MRKAFTLMELIIVMVILGILASLGSEMIASMYQDYIKTKSVNKLELQTQITLEQIAKKLQHRIKDSVAATKINEPTADIVSVAEGTENDRVLLWVGRSYESSLGLDGWSGLIDINNTKTNPTTGILYTPKSNLNNVKKTIKTLSNQNNNDVAIIFMGLDERNISKFWDYSLNKEEDAYAEVEINGKESFKIKNNDKQKKISAYYQLSHTAYALVPSNESKNFTLRLYYDFKPWNKEHYTRGKNVVIAEHVSTFRFIEADNVLRIKLCLHDANTSSEDDFAICKEKVVF